MKRWTIVVLLLVAVAALVWAAVTQMPDGRLHVYFLDVDSGQAVIVRTPSGRVALIDGGPEPSVLLTALGRYLPFWQRSLQAVIATRQGNAAIAALFDVCQRYEVITVLAPPAGDRPTVAFQHWRTLLAQRGQPLSETLVGAVLDLGDGVLLHIAAVADGAAALRISHGNVEVSLPGALPSASSEANAVVTAFPATSKLPSSFTPGANVRTVILFSGKLGAGTPLPTWPGVSVFGTSTHGALEMISNGSAIELRSAR